jgi:2-oxoacid:acceptor oxidoreductase delta subunit (pyruvate/2-ketoisovalerate family)
MKSNFYERESIRGIIMAKKSWSNINKSRSERPLCQSYEGFEDLPPIPISFPQQGAIGRTGDWRTYRPVVDHANCSKCGFCYMYCPEGTILYNEVTGEYTVDLEYCKGCGICARHCPKKCIKMDLEHK